MPDGLSTATADTILTGVTDIGLWVQCHDASPGASGDTRPVGSRATATWGAPSAGTVTTDPAHDTTWESWDGGPVTVTHVSLWTAQTDGQFVAAIELTAPVTANNGDSLTLTAVTLALQVAS